jgi:hypothetical protein
MSIIELEECKWLCLLFRHAREGGHPSGNRRGAETWIPAFPGMTEEEA